MLLNLAQDLQVASGLLQTSGLLEANASSTEERDSPLMEIKLWYSRRLEEL